MSAPVGPLAVLDAASAGCPDPKCDACVEIARVRADFAELIDAASAGHEMQIDGGGTALYFNVDKAERLRAALARCRGGES